VEERELKMDELNLVAETFITATNKDIVPVVQIDGKKIGDGKPGEKTKRLMEIFADFVRNY